MPISNNHRGFASKDHYDYAKNWTKEMVDFMRTPNYEWIYDNLAGKFNCPCGKFALYLSDQMETGIPEKLCPECWDDYLNYRLNLIRWKRRSRVPRNQWHLIPEARYLFDVVTEWDEDGIH